MSDDPFDRLNDGDSDPLEDQSKDHPLEANTDDVGVLQRVRAWVSSDASEDDPAPTDEPSAFAVGKGKILSAVTSTRAKKLYIAIGLVAGAVLAFNSLLQSRGVVAAVVYSLLFVFCATLFPIAINIAGGATPNSIGKLHLLLGAVAFDHHYLVQRDRGWEWCPGERGRVWIDDEWHEVAGEEHYSILGWRPFGILRYKDGDTWAEKRVDESGLNARSTHEIDPSAAADGGAVSRGGFDAVERPIISGQKGTWLLDLRQVFTTGIRKIGDVDLVETAEEVIEREQVNDSKMGNAGPLLETMGGLAFGIVAGLAYLFLLG